jgi:tetratricopeptide (TPR) repeat protein
MLGALRVRHCLLRSARGISRVGGRSAKRERRIPEMKAAILLLAALPLSAQQAEAPKLCGDGRTVDDYVREIDQSRNGRRTKNPFPDTVCILGWCKEMPKASAPPGPFPDPPQAKPQPRPERQSVSVPGASSSKDSKIQDETLPNTQERDETCDVQHAAHDVYIGDIYFKDKNYKSALNRYKLALENWMNEPAIHYRLGRTYEALKDLTHSAEQYQRVIDVGGDTALAEEARAALSRVKK